MRHLRLLSAAVLIAAAVGPAAWAAGPASWAAPLTHADRRAGLDARIDVARAATAGDRNAALGRLDGTELALLARQSQDAGPLLQPDRSAARTSAISELDQARVDVLMTDAHQARTSAFKADQALGAEHRTAP